MKKKCLKIGFLEYLGSSVELGIFSWTESLRMDLIQNICVLGNWIKFYFKITLNDLIIIMAENLLENKNC
jgi:hypothetical protein